MVAAQGLSLVEVSRGHSLVVKHRLLIAAASVVEPGFQAHGLQLWLCVSSVVVVGLIARGRWNLPRPGVEPAFPALSGGFLTIRPPGSFRQHCIQDIPMVQFLLVNIRMSHSVSRFVGVLIKSC